MTNTIIVDTMVSRLYVKTHLYSEISVAILKYGISLYVKFSCTSESRQVRQNSDRYFGIASCNSESRQVFQNRPKSEHLMPPLYTYTIAATVCRYHRPVKLESSRLAECLQRRQSFFSSTTLEFS